jgi:hypothetical protein
VDTAPQRLPRKAQERRGPGLIRRGLVLAGLTLPVATHAMAQSAESTDLPSGLHRRWSLDLMNTYGRGLSDSKWTLLHDIEPRVEIESDRWRVVTEGRLVAAEFKIDSQVETTQKNWFTELNICTRSHSTLCLGRVVSDPLWAHNASALGFLGRGATIDGFGWGLGSLEDEQGWKTRVGFDGDGSFFLSLSAFGDAVGWQTILAHRRFESGFFGDFPADRTEFLTRFGVRSYDEISVAAYAGEGPGFSAQSGVRVRSAGAQKRAGEKLGEDPVDMRVLAQAMYGFNDTISLGAGVLGLSQVRGVVLTDSDGSRQKRSVGTSAMGSQLLARYESEWIASEWTFELFRKSGEELVSASSFMASGKVEYSCSLLWGLKLRMED